MKHTVVKKKIITSSFTLSVLRFMGISTSGDTVLRIVKRTSLNQESSPRVVSLDDWAIRKGFNYGSIIIDHETRRVIELVRGRFAEDIQPWFEAHPEIEIVTRDRSLDYRKRNR